MTDDITEFANEDDEASSDLKLEDFSKAVLWGTDWTVETVLAQLKRGNIELNPRFQRRDAWNKTAKSRFVESVVLGLPIPQVVLAEHPEQRGRYIILDGKQRLLALMQFAGYAEGNSNGFGLSGLDVRTDLARKKYKHFERDPNLRADLDAFLTHTLRTVVIRNWPSLGFLHIVFQRLNTGSLKLSPQELRQALAPGKFTDFVDDTTIDARETQILLGRETPDPRMRDVELMVRFLSFKLRLPEYTGRMKEFLDTTCVYFNKNWTSNEAKINATTEDFKAGVRALEGVFGQERIARKPESRLFNRSIFDTLIYYASDNDTRAAMLENREAVQQAYAALFENDDFKIAVESDTAGIPHTADRLRLWGAALSGAIQRQLEIPALAENQEGQLRFTV
jgi:hypothetical protein